MFIYPATNNILFKAIMLPLHTGVVVFVLISGYFGIIPTSRGVFKLLGGFFVYCLSEVFYNVATATSVLSSIRSLLFLSNSHFWFVKTYLFLYLISPMLNVWKEYASLKQRWYMIVALSFVCIYMATIGGDETLRTGKNLINFVFLYLVGNQIKETKYIWERINAKWLFVGYLLFNLVLVEGYLCFYSTRIGSSIWILSFPYCSPILLMNSILLFILFGNIKLQSFVINWMARSCFAIYLIHANRPYVIGLIGSAALWIANTTNNGVWIVFACVGLTFVVVLCCILIDKLLTPVWKLIDRLGNKVYIKLGY